MRTPRYRVSTRRRRSPGVRAGSAGARAGRYPSRGRTARALRPRGPRTAVASGRRVFEGDEQAAAAGGQLRVQLVRVAPAQFGRQGDQRGAIEHRVAIAQQVRIQPERVAEDQFDPARLVMAAVMRVADFGPQAVFGEELRDREFRQFDAEHAMALRREPGHVQRFPRQWHEHLRARGHAERGPVLEQQRRRRGLVEADLVVLPALMPEIGVHRDLPLRFAKGEEKIIRPPTHPPSASRAAASRRAIRARRGNRRAP